MSVNAIQAAIAQAAAQKDMNVAQAGGNFEAEPFVKGLTIVTLIGYVEIGVQQHDIPNKPSYDSDDVQLIFECAGGANKPLEVEKEDGTKVKIAKRITVTEKLSLNEKANFFKIFQQLNYDGQATHMAQLVGKHFLAVVYPGGDKGQYGNFREKGGSYNFQPPFVMKGDPLDPSSQTRHDVPKPEQLSEARIFLWDYASKEMWDALFIDGEYPAKDGKPAKSKNVLQNKIKGAKNFKGSPIQKLLGDEALDLTTSPLAEEPKVEEKLDVADVPVNTAGGAADDPLADLMG